MKYLLFILLPFSIYAQNSSMNTNTTQLSVIGLDKMNVVYRGIPNPISIAVNDAKSFKISGEGVSQNEDGKYIIHPKSGTETKVFVEIEKIDGKNIVEEHTIRIKGLPSGFVTINSSGCNRKCVVELSKDEIQGAIIDYEMPEFLFDYKINVTQFEIILLDKKYDKIGKNITIQGNKIDNKTCSIIKKMHNISFLIIHNVHFQLENLDLYICKIPPLKVMISE